MRSPRNQGGGRQGRAIHRNQEQEGRESFHTFTSYVKMIFFRGTSLRPAPSGGKAKDARWIDVHEDALDEAQMETWIRQAAALPGWGKS